MPSLPSQQNLVTTRPSWPRLSRIAWRSPCLSDPVPQPGGSKKNLQRPLAFPGAEHVAHRPATTYECLADTIRGMRIRHQQTEDIRASPARRCADVRAFQLADPARSCLLRRLALDQNPQRLRCRGNFPCSGDLFAVAGLTSPPGEEAIFGEARRDSIFIARPDEDARYLNQLYALGICEEGCQVVMLGG